MLHHNASEVVRLGGRLDSGLTWASASAEDVMKYAYTIEEELVIAERADLAIRGLGLGVVTDGEAIAVLRAARLCTTRGGSNFSAGINGARRDVARALLGLIEAHKKNGPRGNKIELALKGVEAWNRELAAL